MGQISAQVIHVAVLTQGILELDSHRLRRTRRNAVLAGAFAIVDQLKAPTLVQGHAMHGNKTLGVG